MDMQPNSSNSDSKKPEELTDAPAQADDSATQSSSEGGESYNLGGHSLVIQPPEPTETETVDTAPEPALSDNEAISEQAPVESEEPEVSTPVDMNESLAVVNTTESEPWSAPLTAADTAPTSAATALDDSSTDAKIAEANGMAVETASDDPSVLFPAGTLSPTPPKKSWWSKKHAIMVGVIAVVVVALGGGSAAAYSLWYQAPSKVLSDATLNFISAKSMTYTGSLTSSTDGTDFALSMNGGSSGQTASINLDAKINSGSTKFDIPVSLVGNAQTFYFKLSNLGALESQLINPYLSMGGSATAGDQAKIDAFVKQIDGTWYSVTPDDLNQSNTNKQTGQCVQNVISDIRTNKSTQNELLKIYQAHPLFTVSKNLGSQNGNLGYELKPVSSTDAKATFDAFKTTSTYKSLVKCDSSYASAFDTSDTSSTTDTPAIDVWVSRWSHQLTKVTMSDNSAGSKVNFSFEPKVNAPANISTPKNAKSIKDLSSQIETLSESLGTSDVTGFSTGPAGTTEATTQNQAQIEAQVRAETQRKQAQALALQSVQ